MRATIRWGGPWLSMHTRQLTALSSSARSVLRRPFARGALAASPLRLASFGAFNSHRRSLYPPRRASHHDRSKAQAAQSRARAGLGKPERGRVAIPGIRTTDKRGTCASAVRILAIALSPPVCGSQRVMNGRARRSGRSVVGHDGGSGGKSNAKAESIDCSRRADHWNLLERRPDSCSLTQIADDARGLGPDIHPHTPHHHTPARTTMLLRRHGSGEIVDSRSLGQMLDLLQSHDVYERLFARDALCLQIDGKVCVCWLAGWGLPVDRSVCQSIDRSIE